MPPEVGPPRPDLSPGLELVYEQEWPRLVRVAFLLTGSRSAAEDVVQDAFVRLYAAGSPVRVPAAYVRTAVVNACRDRHRHQAVVARTPLHAPDPVRAEHDEMSDALAKLPWRQQAALVLRYYLDLTETEIATALDCRPTTVRSLIHRGLGRLRKELAS